MAKCIWKKIVFEIRMQIMDARWRHSFLRSCWEPYPPFVLSQIYAGRTETDKRQRFGGD